MSTKNTTKLGLPFDKTAERAIFSVILNEPDKLVGILDGLEPRDFYWNSHREIWQSIQAVARGGQDIDVVSVKAELRKQELNVTPAITALVECYDMRASAGNLDSFVKVVKGKSLLRQLIGTTIKYSQSARLDNADVETLLVGLEQDIIELSDALKDERPIDAGGILDEVRLDMLRGEDSGWQGFATGFKSLDKNTGGFLPTHCWVVGAYTGVGKTFFILQMVLNVLEQGARIALFSTEMDRKMNMLRLLGNKAGLGTINILKGHLNPEEKAKLHDAESYIVGHKSQLTIYDNVYTVEGIRLKAKKQKLKGGLDIIFVDFIQNLRGDQNIYERMSNAALELQKIAQELNVTMVLASQVTQSSAGWKRKEAIEYKGAGEIAAIADVGLWIRKKEEQGLREVILRKIRHGKPGYFNTRISFPSGRVIDMETIVAETTPEKKGVGYDESGKVTEQLGIGL